MRKLIALSLCFITAALAGAWRIEVVDPDADGHCSLALDSNDYPHISYQYIGGDWVLKYAHWNGYEWNIEVADDEYPCGWETSIAIDSNDLPHIAHRFVWAQEGVRYARWNGSSWILRTLSDGFPHDGLSIYVDSNDNVHFAFWDGWSIVYKVWDGDSWDSEYLDEVEYVSEMYISIAADSGGNPHIIYNTFDVFDYTKYAYFDGLEWNISFTELGVEYLSLIVDSQDTPWASYSGDGLNIGYYDYYYEEWFCDTVDSGGQFSSIEVDANDWPHCSHAGNRYLHYSRWTGLNWLNEQVDRCTGSCQYTSLELDSNDLPHICYFDAGTDALIYARWDPNGFHLDEPDKGEVVETTTPLLDWEDSPVPEHESFTLWWGTDPDFDTYTEVTDIAESEYQIMEGIEDEDRIYWRVKSVDDQSEEYWAEEMDWYFYVDLGGGIDIVDFAANSEDEGVLVNWRIEGDSPSGLRVLRSVGDAEPVAIHDNPLPGTATHYLDRKDKGLDKGLQPLAAGMEYCYWLEVTESDGTVKRFGPTEAVSIPEQISRLALGEPYPSPARDAVTLTYDLPNGCSDAVIEVYDLSGRRLDSIPLTDSGEITLDVSDYASGVYTARLSTEEGSVSRRLVITR